MENKKTNKPEAKSNTMRFYSEREVEWKGNKFQRKVSFAGVIEANKLSIGKSECCNHDIYNKKLGRKIAEGRAIKTPILIVDIEDVTNFKESCNIFINKCKNLLNPIKFNL